MIHVAQFAVKVYGTKDEIYSYTPHEIYARNWKSNIYLTKVHPPTLRYIKNKQSGALLCSRMLPKPFQT